MTTTIGSHRRMIVATITSPEHQTEVRTAAVVVVAGATGTEAGGSAGAEEEAEGVEDQGFY